MKSRKRKDILLGIFISTLLVLLLVKSQSSFFTKQIVANQIFDFGYNAAILDQQMLRIRANNSLAHDSLNDALESLQKSFNRIRHIISSKQDASGRVKNALNDVKNDLTEKKASVKKFIIINTKSRELKKSISDQITRIMQNKSHMKSWPKPLALEVRQLTDMISIYLDNPTASGIIPIKDMVNTVTTEYPKETLAADISLLKTFSNLKSLLSNEQQVNLSQEKILNINLMSTMSKFQRAYDDFYLQRNEQANNYRILLFLTSVLFFLIIVRFFMKIHMQSERLRQEIQEKKLAESALRTHRDNLEKIVHQRTMELSDANVSLATEMEERELAESEKIKLCRELDRSKKLSAVGVLASGIAKDFDSLLSSILDNVRHLTNELTRNKKAQPYLEAVNESTERAAELTKLLLDFSSKTPHDKDMLSLNEVINEACNFLKTNVDESIEIKTQLAEDLWVTRGDGTQILQVFVDLGINSRDAMPNGGEITFITQNFILDEVLAKYYSKLEPGNYVQISVIDTGDGIPEDIIDNIFDPYFTTKDGGKGTGLGLSQVYGIIEAHNAAIRVYSHKGRGTVFHIYFPTYTEDDIQNDSETTKFEQDAEVDLNANILVIDDERSIREIAKTILEDRGARVWTATDGYEGWKYYESHKDKIDLTILDLRLPTMSGEKAFDRIRDINPDAKILFSSGHPDSKDVEQLQKCGNVDFITKPFTRDTLLAKIKDFLENQSNTIQH